MLTVSFKWIGIGYDPAEVKKQRVYLSPTRSDNAELFSSSDANLTALRRRYDFLIDKLNKVH